TLLTPRVTHSSMLSIISFTLFFFNDPAPTEIYTLSLHDALPILTLLKARADGARREALAADLKRLARLLANPLLVHRGEGVRTRSEEHTSELQSRGHLVCRLLLEKKNRRPTSTRLYPASFVGPFD